MCTISYEIKEELHRFGLWAQEYLKSVNYPEWEVDYPRWQILYDITFKAIDILTQIEDSSEIANLILDVMALDNESELVLDECENKLDVKGLSILYEIGVNHPNWNARWQVAELIGRRKHMKSQEFLLKLIDDNEEYVIRRALFSLAKINPRIAEKVALEKLHSEYEYLRLGSLATLEEVSSEYFENAVKELEEDSSKIIRGWIDSRKK